MHNHENTIVKESLAEALLLLMETQEYTQITITNIAKKAGVSRMAYYRNFDTKEDILSYYFACSCQELYEKINFPKDTSDALLYIYTLFTEKKALIYALKKANLTNILLAYFDQIIMEGNKILKHQYPTKGPKNTYHLYFLSGAFYNFFMKWFDNGMNESFDELLEIVASSIPEHHKHK